jgi:uncharacterized protein YcaQ
VTEPLVLSASEAQAIAFRASFGGNGRPDPVSRAAAALDRLGYVQIDTISVVERAHHHILWNRDREYRPAVLPGLEEAPRRIFEYWAHAAAYLPLSDYRYCLPRMRRIATDGHEWFASDRRMEDWVRDRIRAEGPLRSQDFESDGARGPWWDWKPAKAALEYLFQCGELMVAARPGFQKLYDLTERILPSGTDTTFPSEEEMGDWYVRRAASSLGVFSLRDIAYQRKDGTAGIAGALDRACEADFLKPCTVQSGKSWCDSGLLAGCTGCGDDRQVRIVSPFDNLIIDRKRANRIFGLEYTLECYVPAAKRKFGYFALPVFYQGRPVGLLDCKADRKNAVLRVNRAGFVWGAEPAEGPDGFNMAFAVELKAFAEFNGCTLNQ